MANNFAVTVTAKDSATGTLNAINQRFASINKEIARSRAPFDKLVQNATTFSRTTGIDEIASGLNHVARAGFQAFQSAARVVEPLAAITSAASIGGMIRLATAWADFGTQLKNTSARAGLSSDQLMILQNAGRLAGVSADAMTSGMTNLKDGMTKAVGGQASQVVSMLQALNLSLEDAKRYAGNTSAALPELADKIAALKDPTVQAEAATTLFGGAGEAMLPFLRKGSAGIAEYIEKARKYGVINDQAAASADNLRESQTDLTLAVEGLGNRISERLGPTIGPMLTHLADWIATSPVVTRMVDFLGAAVQRLGGWLEHIDWDALGTRLDQWGERLKSVLALLQRFGILPDLSGVSGGGGAPTKPNLPPGSPLATPDSPAAPQAPDTRHWYERFYKPGPGVFNGLFGHSGPSTATPSASHADFYRTYGSAAAKAGAALGVDPATILGHWAQETAYGRNVHDFNVGNMQAGAGYQGRTVVRGDTHADGTPYQTAFRAYDNPEQFADDYVSLLKRRYAKALGAGSDALKFGQGLKDGGYMENPNGPQDIANTARRVAAEEAALGPRLSLPSNAGTAANPGNIANKATIDGNVNVGIKVTAPPGTQTTAVQSGASLGPLKVERTDVGYGNGRDG